MKAKQKQKNILPYTMEEVRDAFNEAMEECYLHGLDWREHMKPFFKNGMIAGYYVFDETKSTIIRKVMI